MEMTTLKCTLCGADVEVPQDVAEKYAADNTAFICDECMKTIDVPAEASEGSKEADDVIKTAIGS